MSKHNQDKWAAAQVKQLQEHRLSTIREYNAGQFEQAHEQMEEEKSEGGDMPRLLRGCDLSTAMCLPKHYPEPQMCVQHASLESGSSNRTREEKRGNARACN